MKTITNKIMIVATSLITVIIIGCGGANDLQVRNGFYVNSPKIASVNAKTTDNSQVAFLGQAIDKFQELYGSCDKEVYIDLKDSSFYSKDLDTMVSGLTYNHGNSCDITIVVNPKSSCDTAQVLWHELYHCCKNVAQHSGWVYDIMDSSEAWGQEGGCSAN